MGKKDKKKKDKKKGKKEEDMDSDSISDLTLSFSDIGSSGRAAKPAPVAGTRVTKPVKRVVKQAAPVAQPAASAGLEELPPLPDLPKFIKPEDIKEMQTFDFAPQEGKGKIKEVIWNYRVEGADSRMVQRQTRKLSALMSEALTQLKQGASQPRQRLQQPVVASQPAAPAVSSIPMVKEPARRPTPQPAAQSTASFRDLTSQKPIPQKVITSALTDESLKPLSPISKTDSQEAQSVMAPSAASAFASTTEATSYQPASRPQPQTQPTFMRIEGGGTPAAAAPAAAPAGTRPTHQGTGVDQVLPGGRRICGRCGGKRFKEENDKTKPLSFTPPFLYAKKYICKDCGKLFTGGEQEQEYEPTPVQQQPVTAQPVAVKMEPTAWETDASSGVQVQSISQASSAQPSGIFGGDGWSHQPLPGAAPAGSEYSGVEGAQPGSTRKTCPNCGGTAFNLVEDRNQPISFGSGGMGQMYKKVNVCKKCGTTLQE
ncbi:MAG: hypothetical protein ACFFCS_05030, partial [Candidatus Hodarchaeota archaeon]